MTGRLHLNGQIVTPDIPPHKQFPRRAVADCLHRSFARGTLDNGVVILWCPACGLVHGAARRGVDPAVVASAGDQPSLFGGTA